MSFWGELRRRNVVKVAVGYAIVAWLLVQIADTFFPALQLPEWTVTFVAAVLVLGFPVALLLSWAYELTPDGIKRTKEVPLAESITQLTSQKLNYIVTGLLVLAVAFMAADNYVLNDSQPNVAEPSAVAEAGSAPPLSATSEDEGAALPGSVAILPCESFSTDSQNDFFAASLHEELLNQLFKLRNMNVIARTSVLQYAGVARPITEIAKELHVESVMECSVAYGDGRIVISAQLIDGDSGLHIWSDRYNREFKDVFGIQADIAMNVANALAVEFSTEEQRAIEQEETDSPEAYALYLRALRAADTASRIRLLDQALSFDPNFAIAHSFKATQHSSFVVNTAASNSVGEEERNRQIELARIHQQRAAELDPDLAWRQDLGYNFFSWRWNDTLDALERAPDPIGNAAWAYSVSGLHKTAIARARRGAALDPNQASSWLALGIALAYAGQQEEASLILRKAIEIEPVAPLSHSWLAFVEIARGNDAEALNQLRLT
jgi:TolB-like protein